MSMNPDEKDFQRLRQLLQLKGHESPPPRYFNEFSGHVISRIRAGRVAMCLEPSDGMAFQSPWMQRLWQIIEHQPAVSGLFTALACGLLVAGIFVFDNTPLSLNITAGGMATVQLPAMEQSEQKSFSSTRTSTSFTLFDNITNPAMSSLSTPSLFGGRAFAPAHRVGMPASSD